jgi:hypothetical protein
VTSSGWALSVPKDNAGLLTIARDPTILDREPSGVGANLRAFLPERSHALIRFDTTQGEQALKTALGLYGPAAEAQAQSVMARFESLYGNRVRPFRLETIPLMEDVPRPAGSQYGIDPVEQRIASDVYGLPGDFLLAGRVPLDAGIRKALGQNALGYGAVVLDKDSIEFTGVMPNPGLGLWKREAAPSSMSVSGRIHDLRTTRSLRTLASAVRKYDGYLWRLSLRGAELDRDRFFDRLLVSPQWGRAWLYFEGSAPREALVWSSEDLESALTGAIPDIARDDIALRNFDRLPPLENLAFLGSPDRVGRWQRWRLLTNAGVPAFVESDLADLLASVSPSQLRSEQGQIAERLIGWSVIVCGPPMPDELRSFLESTKDAELTDVLGYWRAQIAEYLRIIENE